MIEPPRLAEVALAPPLAPADRTRMLSGISITCFAASYAVALALEVSRLWMRMPVRAVVMLGFAVAGVFAQSVYLVREAGNSPVGSAPLSSWYHWCLLASWVLAVAYLVMTLRDPRNTLGIFVLPMVMLLLGLAWLVRNVPPFPVTQATAYWGQIHGFALLLGTAAVSLGFVSGLMFFLQSYRLKHKLPPRPGLRLPSLEWLQMALGRSFFISAALLAIGVISGIVLNAIRQGRNIDSVPWTDPVVLSSMLMLVWLIAASLFEIFYKPARQGRKVAYLTVASFLFLALVLGLLLFGPSQHPSRAATLLPSPLAGEGQGVRGEVRATLNKNSRDATPSRVHRRSIVDATKASPSDTIAALHKINCAGRRCVPAIVSLISARSSLPKTKIAFLPLEAAR